jgi:hypothetical protein
MAEGVSPEILAELVARTLGHLGSVEAILDRLGIPELSSSWTRLLAEQGAIGGDAPSNVTGFVAGRSSPPSQGRSLLQLRIDEGDAR